MLEWPTTEEISLKQETHQVQQLRHVCHEEPFTAV